MGRGSGGQGNGDGLDLSRSAIAEVFPARVRARESAMYGKIRRGRLKGIPRACARESATNSRN